MFSIQKNQNFGNPCLDYNRLVLDFWFCFTYLKEFKLVVHPPIFTEVHFSEFWNKCQWKVQWYYNPCLKTNMCVIKTCCCTYSGIELVNESLTTLLKFMFRARFAPEWSLCFHCVEKADFVHIKKLMSKIEIKSTMRF